MQNTPTSPPTDRHPDRHCPLPVRLELDSVCRILDGLRVRNRPCLDIGFRHPQACARLRAGGGAWSSLALNETTAARLASACEEDVLLVGPRRMLPFEDKQFDVVVLALGSLTSDSADDTALIRECHRVLLTPGTLILTVEYNKPFGLARLFDRRPASAGCGGSFSEAELFDLLKTGFDWLGVRNCSRFWVQLIRQWAERNRPEDQQQSLDPLYWVARQLDVVNFLTRGYLVTAYGRRKGWRPRTTPALADGRSLAEAVLSGRSQ
jgi:SAM-dependent methyltransferase